MMIINIAKINQDYSVEKKIPNLV